MSNSDNIEERLIPYIEGVLNEREQREVDEAIQADAALAREVEELKEVIDELRKGFASGVRPEFSELSVEEVVKMAAHDGNLETMTGTAEQKARLFCNDQALEEYRLLRSLSQDMQQTTLPMAEVPPMPESLLAEIARYKTAETPVAKKVVELAPKLGRETPAMKSGGFFSFLDRINPKPLMATAAALVLFSMGFHAYNSRNPVTGNEPQVAYGYSETATPAAAQSPISEEASKDGKSVIEPTGVTVFTSGDREILKKQAEKLLANKVRYTVTEDRILVSEDEFAQAREALWGKEEGSTVAVAEKRQEELHPEQPKEDVSPYFSAGEDEAQGGMTASAPDKFEPPEMKIYDGRKDRDKEVERKGSKGALDSYTADEQPTPPVVSDPGQSSALRRTSPADEGGPNWTQPSAPAKKDVPATEIATGSTRSSAAPTSSALKGASKEDRERILRDMMLGQTESDNKAKKPAAAAASGTLEEEEAQPNATTISRGRRVESQVENRPAPVTNVITAEQVRDDDLKLE
ncbi:MAG: hypothetical protein KC800_31980, partial [Candidatus Eremiobacteraeota bacterium]|nr:hypothetical protein [Candidatus Eremiobacteraeota bacterium]